MMSFMPYTHLVIRAQWEYSLRQAAELAGVSVDTVKRRLRAGDLPHARQLGDASHTWVVPLGDLVGAGFTITPAHSLQARPPQMNGGGRAGGSTQIEVQLAVAEAVQKVHADYARTLADLTAQAIAALGKGADGLDAPPALSSVESEERTAGEGSGPVGDGEEGG